MTKHSKIINKAVRCTQEETVDSSLMIAFICQPYLAVLQKMLYEKYWKNEVSEVLINVNGCNDTMRQFIVDLWSEATHKDVQKLKNNKERIGYWAWYYLIYEVTKDSVPFPDYNKDYEKEFIKEVEKTDVTLKEIIKEADKLKEEHKELFK